MPPASENQSEARLKLLERAVAAQAELIVSLRLRIEMLERRQGRKTVKRNQMATYLSIGPRTPELQILGVKRFRVGWIAVT